MTFLLDTKTCVQYLRHSAATPVAANIALHSKRVFHPNQLLAGEEQMATLEQTTGTFGQFCKTLFIEIKAIADSEALLWKSNGWYGVKGRGAGRRKICNRSPPGE